MRIIAFVLDLPVIERMELLRNPAFGDERGNGRMNCPLSLSCTVSVSILWGPPI